MASPEVRHVKRINGTRHSSAESDVGVFHPDELWGRPVYLQPLYDATLPFEERVSRAWEHVKATRFSADAHERLRVALAVKIDGERRGVLAVEESST